MAISQCSESMFSEIVGQMWILVLVCLDFFNEEFLFSFVVELPRYY